MASVVCRRRGLPLVFDLRGLLAEEYVDNGNWRRGGLKYSLTTAMERRLLRSASGIVMLTERLHMDFMAMVSNLFNHPNFLFPVSNISAPGPGVLTGQHGFFSDDKSGARLVEMRVRLEF